MESSGSHNTGAANMVDDLYAVMGVKTPGQKFYGDETVTAIKGHPCIIFYSPTGKLEDYDSLISDSDIEDVYFMHHKEMRWSLLGNCQSNDVFGDKNE